MYNNRETKKQHRTLGGKTVRNTDKPKTSIKHTEKRNIKTDKPKTSIKGTRKEV